MSGRRLPLEPIVVIHISLSQASIRIRGKNMLIARKNKELSKIMNFTTKCKMELQRWNRFSNRLMALRAGLIGKILNLQEVLVINRLNSFEANMHQLQK